MQTHGDPRVKKRLPCTLEHADNRRSGLILNLSRSGIFVQTILPAEPGMLVNVDFCNPSHDRPIGLQAAVVWRRRVSTLMTGINQSGMGMRIQWPPSEYDALLAEILPQPPAADQPRGDAPAPGLLRYVVRLTQSGGPRSRLVTVHSESEQRACEQARAELSEGWTILEISES